MNNSILNFERSYKQQPLLFGDELGIYDSIHVNEAVADVMQRALAQNWASDEFNFSPCKAEFAEENDGKELMTRTLLWQWSADSAACNLYTLLQPFISDDKLTQLILFNTYMECLHPDHEVLTPSGWVPIDSVNKGDTVLQFNPKDKTLSFTQVLDTVQKSATQGLISFDSKHFTQLVTPKHRMPVYAKYSFVFKGGETFKFFEACSSPTHGSVMYPTSGYITGSKQVLTPIEKFWIAFQADGTIGNHKKYTGAKTNGLPYIFSFKRQDKIKNFEKLLLELGWHHTWSSTSRGYKKFVVYVPFENLKDNYQAKSFSWVSYENISSSWAEEFLKYLMLWDGCLRPTKNCLGTYVNTNLKAIEKVQTLAHLAGYSGTYYEAPVGDDNRKQAYHITVTKREGTVGNTVEKKDVSYTGDVYCITVQHGAFLTRYHNKISVTGNCIHSETYSEIVKNSFKNPEEVLNSISKDEEVISRLNKVNQTFASFRQAGLDFSTGKRQLDVELFQEVYKGVVALYLMERVQFIASFAITFSLGEMGRFIPVCQAVRKICADETIIHAETDVLILEDLQRHELWKEANTEDFRQDIFELMEEVIKRELEWTDNLFVDKSLPGITPEAIKEWVLFNYQIVKKQLGYEVDSKHKKNPLPWIEHWLSTNSYQAAPQEIELTQYMTGAIDNDLDSLDIEVDF